MEFPNKAVFEMKFIFWNKLMNYPKQASGTDRKKMKNLNNGCASSKQGLGLS